MTEEEDVNEEVILQGDSKPQGINSELWTQTGPLSDTASYLHLKLKSRAIMCIFVLQCF